MERDKSDKVVEEHVVEAIVRKGEQKAVEELKRVGSADDLTQILVGAESKHRRFLSRSASGRGLIWTVSVAAVAVVVLIVGLQPRYSTNGLYERWSKIPTHERYISSQGQEMDSTQKGGFDKNATPNDGEFASTNAADEALFYQAAALAYAGDIDEAIAIFSQLAAKTNSAYSHDAAWQLALIHLRAGDRKKSSAILEDIAQGNSLYKTDAAQLLKEVKLKILF